MSIRLCRDVLREKENPHLYVPVTRARSGGGLGGGYAVLQLLRVLLSLPRADFLLLQNPPCIPTFTVCQLVCSLRRTRFVIDWHNFGASLWRPRVRAFGGAQRANQRIWFWL
jgi:hypothetical protein